MGLDKVEDVLSVGQEVDVFIRNLKKFKMAEVTVVNLPEYSKKKPSDFKPEEEVEGTVTGVSHRAQGGVFVDVGAVIDAYLPRSEIQGDSTSIMKNMYSKGQKVKGKVIV